MANIDTNPQKINDILTRGVHDVFTREELEKKLLSGKQLNIKLGVDVTGPNLHLGHGVIHRKLRDFQELGHKVTFIIGDFTTLVGDHSDKVDMRPETNKEEILENEKSYKQQFFKSVLEELTDVRHNSEWLSSLDFKEVIHLAKQFTISQMLDRETFLKRYQEQKPIGLDEFLYPLMQGYDSVAIDADVELGGTDQTFNLLTGRKLMPVFGKEAQNAISMKLLVGSDGRPMGKSLKNYIPILDSANDMYRKLMSIVDEVIFDYFELLTRIPMEEISEMQQAVKNGENPMIFKKILALDITSFYHGLKSAKEAQDYFERTIQNKEALEEIALNISSISALELGLHIKQILGLNISNSEVRRIIEQGGFELNSEKITDLDFLVNPKTGDAIKLGKRVFFRVL